MAVLQVFRRLKRRANAMLDTREVAGSKPAAPITTNVLFGGKIPARELGAKHQGSVAPAPGARLAAVEPEPFGVGDRGDDAGDLFIGRGLRRDDRGVCLGLGRPDVARAA
jgi:hypothetical protein